MTEPRGWRLTSLKLRLAEEQAGRDDGAAGPQLWRYGVAQPSCHMDGPVRNVEGMAQTPCDRLLGSVGTRCLARQQRNVLAEVPFVHQCKPAAAEQLSYIARGPMVRVCGCIGSITRLATL